MYVYTNVNICAYAHLYTYTCVCIDVCIFICTYICRSMGKIGAVCACSHRRAADTGERPHFQKFSFPLDGFRLGLFNTMGKLVKIWVGRSRVPVQKNMQCFPHPCPDTSSLSKGTNPLKKETETFLQLEKYQDKFLKLLLWEGFHIASLTENRKTMLEKLRTVLLLSKCNCGIL